MNGKMKRILSLVLTAVMLIGMFPAVGATAATTETVMDGVTRIYGDNRYETAFGVADATREFTGRDPEYVKFDAVVVAYGREFADALAGSYLAISKGAPILLISNFNREEVKDYIRANLNEGGTVYLLGGTAVVPEDMEQGLDGFQVKRLWGANRLGTNLAILNEVPIGDRDLLVCTGWEYADALSASATGLPIMLVSPRGLTNEQKAFLEGVTGNIIICGGTNAVSADIEAALSQYGTVERLAGSDRYHTSVLVAERFISEPNGVVLAYGRDFPDGLCGGVLANFIDAPVILTKTGVTDEAAAYVQRTGITQGVVLGGSGLISNAAVCEIFGSVFTVEFDPCGGSAVPAQEVIAGQLATEPLAPVKDGYSFGGWYLDPYYTSAFDFTTPIVSDVILYARWRQIDNLEDEEIDLGDIHYMASQGEIEVMYGDKGEITMIDGTFTNQTVTNEEEAADVLNDSAALFDEYEFHAEPEDITAVTVDPGTANEENFFRYTPTYNGIPVLGSQIILTSDAVGKVTGLFSSFTNKIYETYTYSSIDEEYAIDEAIEALMDRDDVEAFLESIPNYWENEYEYEQNFRDSLDISVTQLIYAADQNVDPRLVYEVRVTNNNYEGSTDEQPDEQPAPGAADGEGAPAIDQTYYVNANNDYGEIYKVIDNTEGWQSVTLEAPDATDTIRQFKGQEENNVFRLQDTTRNLITYKADGFTVPGNIAQSEVEDGRTVIEKRAVSAHYNMTQTYDFYKNVLGRTSFDGRGATVKTSYDYGYNYNNAYWTPGGQQFVFGSGADYVDALDIVGHEFTHAVINYVVGNGYDTTLTYWGETGALNEAYADIMGNFVEGKTGTDFWNHGEDKGNVTRSMADPTAYGQPDHYSALSDPSWSAQLNQYQNRDNEGVHIFGGVFCHAVYKMMTDSRCAGISQETWAKIFYRSLFRLTTDATFLDARGAVICAAKNMGFDHSKQQAIKDAFDAVGIKEPDTIRFILTWGEVPSDLDSHLVGPGVDGDRFHVYYGDRTYYQDGSYWSDSSEYAVDLDYDDVTSFGPEVTTIHVLRPGEYYFYVHDYTNGYYEESTEMAHSGATVKVYRGSASTPVAEYYVDPSSQGTIWNVCKVTIGSNGTVFIEGINTYGSERTYY